ncbi:MAG: hypothetical protein NTW56_12490 [Alphaproteobacteria bacterium]|nr:hypothetical protein [Alphaproteobacteria bacterium]
MSNNDKPDAQPSPEAANAGRRRLVLRFSALGLTALGGAACVPVQPVYTGPMRTGITDADPSDGPGQGRGGMRAGGFRTGVTDADPSDGPGRGRGGFRGGGGYRSGLTDSDPSDGPGRGRRGF